METFTMTAGDSKRISGPTSTTAQQLTTTRQLAVFVAMVLFHHNTFQYGSARIQLRPRDFIESNCPPGWVYYEPENVCMTVPVFMQLTWDDAREFCQTMTENFTLLVSDVSVLRTHDKFDFIDKEFYTLEEFNVWAGIRIGPEGTLIDPYGEYVNETELRKEYELKLLITNSKSADNPENFECYRSGTDGSLELAPCHLRFANPVCEMTPEHIANACENSNGGCSHTCVPTGFQTRTCTCPDDLSFPYGYALLNDETTCTRVFIDDCKPDNGGCDQTCKSIVVEGPQCSCLEGYVQRGKKKCDDVNECSDGNNGGCVQICTNTMGGRLCSCSEEYIRINDTVCIKKPTTPIFVQNGKKGPAMGGLSENETLIMTLWAVGTLLALMVMGKLLKWFMFKYCIGKKKGQGEEEHSEEKVAEATNGKGGGGSA